MLPFSPPIWYHVTNHKPTPRKETPHGIIINRNQKLLELAAVISDQYDLILPENTTANPQDEELLYRFYLAGLKHGILFGSWLADDGEPLSMEKGDPHREEPAEAADPLTKEG